MTIVVAFYCSDGVVVASDSMITPSIGQTAVGHHHGRKIAILSEGQQLFAYAGDQGQSARFRFMADRHRTMIPGTSHALDFPIFLTQEIVVQFASTGIEPSMIDVSAVLAFAHDNAHCCCVFEGSLQPRLLDRDHFYVALGSGKLSADPFLRFLVDVFCAEGQPKLSDGTFLAVWTVQHVIDTNPGGVAAPIRVATFHADQAGQYVARELLIEDIDEHQNARERALGALRRWRDELRGAAVHQGVIANKPSLNPAANIKPADAT